MADEPQMNASVAPESDAQKAEAKSRQKVAGNLTYINNFGSIKPVLEKIETASKPDKFTQEYLATVLKLSGGAYKAVIPVLKRVGFLTSDGTPTEAYSKFRTEGGKSEAAYLALRNGFAELFRKNEHVYAADDKKLTDLIVETTGRAKEEAVVGAIRGTFKVFSSYLPKDFSPGASSPTPPDVNDSSGEEFRGAGSQGNSVSIGGAPLNLAYNINVVLPETKDIEVFNVIFRSLRDNLLR